MKRKSLLVSIGLAFVAAFGLVGGLSAVKHEVKETKAETATYYFSRPTDWTNVYVHYWGGNNPTTWPGNVGTCTGWKNESNQEIWAITIDPSNTGFKIHDNNGHESNDLSVSSLTVDTDNAFWLNGKNFGGKWNYELPSKDIYFYNKDRYIDSDDLYVHAWGGNRTTIGLGSVKMSKVAGANRLYSAKIYSTNTAVIFSKGYGGNQNQTSDITLGSKDTIVLNTSWGTSEVNFEAANFVDSYLHFHDVSLSNNEGGTACLTYFGLAKTAYNNLSSDAIRSEAAGIENVEARLSAWAAANHSTFSISNGFGSQMRVNYLGTNNSSTIIAVISTIALIAVASIFLLKKKKEN